MSEWKKVKLGDCCEITSAKRCHASERSREGVPFYCSKEIIQLDKGEEVRDSDYIPVELYDLIRQKYDVPKPGDLLLTTRGTNGIPYIYKDSDCFYFADGNLSWFKKFNNQLNVRYLYYWFKSHVGKHSVDSISKGTAQKAVPIEGLRGIDIELPEKATQHRIASILSRYDSLIENYQKQIKLLEEAAQRLYKEWFVDLHFPGHENTKIIDGVPEGWEKKKISEVCDTTSGGTPSRSKKEFYTGDILWVKTKELNDDFIFDTEEKITEGAIRKSSAKLIPSGSILMAMYGATIGKLGIATKELSCNQACCVFLLSEENALRLYLYNWLLNNRTILIAMGKGAAQPNLSQDMIKKLEILIPSLCLLKNFDSKVKPIYKELSYLSSQIRLLTEARDRLLPKLMSGEIAV